MIEIVLAATILMSPPSMPHDPPAGGGPHHHAAPSPTIPSMAQLDLFLQRDQTSEHRWTPNYDCWSFATSLCAAARRAGLPCGIVVVQGNLYAHALNIFPVQSMGTIYVEPQDDRHIVDLQSLVNRIYGGAFGKIIETTVIWTTEEP